MSLIALSLCPAMYLRHQVRLGTDATRISDGRQVILKRFLTKDGTRNQQAVSTEDFPPTPETVACISSRSLSYPQFWCCSYMTTLGSNIRGAHHFLFPDIRGEFPLLCHMMQYMPNKLGDKSARQPHEHQESRTRRDYVIRSTRRICTVYRSV